LLVFYRGAMPPYYYFGARNALYICLRTAAPLSPIIERCVERTLRLLIKWIIGLLIAQTGILIAVFGGIARLMVSR
jgi:hypothetical protein